MTTTSNELPALNMTEWLEPETFTKIVRSLPSVITTLSKLKKMFPKGRGTKRDLKQLGEDIDALAKTLEKVCEVIKTHMNLSTKLAEASVPFATIVGKRISELVQWANVTQAVTDHINKSTPVLIAHETRLKALEASMVKAKSKQSSRSAGISKTKKPKKRKK